MVDSMQCVRRFHTSTRRDESPSVDLELSPGATKGKLWAISAAEACRMKSVATQLPVLSDFSESPTDWAASFTASPAFSRACPVASPALFTLACTLAAVKSAI